MISLAWHVRTFYYIHLKCCICDFVSEWYVSYVAILHDCALTDYVYMCTKFRLTYAYTPYICVYVRTYSVRISAHRGDYNSLTSDIFRSVWQNVRPLIHYFSNAIHGYPTKLSDNMAIDGFWPIISASLM